LEKFQKKVDKMLCMYYCTNQIIQTKESMVMENRKIQHRKKMAAPIIIAVLLILWYIGMAIACFCIPEIPFIFKILMAIIPAAISGVISFVLAERIKEIRSGEEDDLSKY
jgi:hypothetical protein